MLDKESTTFHNEDAVFRIAMWANIVSWVGLVLSLIMFGNTVYSISSQWAMVSQSLPPDFFGKIAAFAGIFSDPILGGVFAFLALQGISQGLYILMDLYMEDEEYEEDETEEAESED